ncbi:hypothetical protein Tco_0643135, partial [Tanacetum coccineum]
TEISQSSRHINLVPDETVYKEWEDRMERAAVGNPLSLHFNKINKKIRKNVERESRERKLERKNEIG